MISDVLHDAADKITSYRRDFPDYDADPRIARWLDVIVNELATLGALIGDPPPPDNRTHRGECRNCHEITVINLGTLSCEPCQARISESLEMLAEAAPSPEELDAQGDAQHAEWLDVNTERLTGYLQKLDKADRDHILAAITSLLLEAR